MKRFKVCAKTNQDRFLESGWTDRLESALQTLASISHRSDVISVQVVQQERTPGRHWGKSQTIQALSVD